MYCLALNHSKACLCAVPATTVQLANDTTASYSKTQILPIAELYKFHSSQLNKKDELFNKYNEAMPTELY